MGSAIRVDVDEGLEEARRKELLVRSDALLEEVEQLLLRDRADLPDPLADAIAELDQRLARSQPQNRARTLRAAHRWVFAVQQRLMASNPMHRQPRPHPGRAAGTPSFQIVSPGARWKFLTLPAAPLPEPDPGPRDTWREAVDLTVERAWDRWAWAQNQAQRAAQRLSTDPDQMEAALAAARAARAAWRNYFELWEEAQILAR